MGEDGREKGIKANNNNINNNPSSPNSIMTLPQENGSGLIEAPVAVPVLTSPVRYAALFYFLSHYISLFFTFLFCLPFFIFFVTHSQIVYLSSICYLLLDLFYFYFYLYYCLYIQFTHLFISPIYTIYYSSTYNRTVHGNTEKKPISSTPGF